MQRIKLIVLCVVCALAVMLVGSAAASAKKALVLVTQDGVIQPGEELEAFSANLAFTTVAGNLECEETTLNGVFDTNDQSKDEATINTAVSKGDFEGIPGACKTALGPAFITTEKLPWGITFATNGVSVAAHRKNKISFTSEFIDFGVKCTFESPNLKSSFAPGPEDEQMPLVLSVDNQLFKENKKVSNGACPHEGTLTGTFDVTSAGRTLESCLAIVRCGLFYRVEGEKLAAGEHKEVAFSAAKELAVHGEIGAANVVVACKALSGSSSPRAVITGGTPGTSEEKLELEDCEATANGETCSAATVSSTTFKNELVTVLKPAAKAGKEATEFEAAFVAPQLGTVKLADCGALGTIEGNLEGQIAGADVPQYAEQAIGAVAFESGPEQIEEVEKTNGKKEKVGVTLAKRPATLEGEAAISLVSGQTWGVF
jgi:hypothetical protein